MGDEISGGRPAPRGRPALVVLVAVVLAVVGVVALRRGVDRPQLEPPAAPLVVQMPPLPGQLVPPTGPPPEPTALLVGDVCLPVRTDGRSILDVSFPLSNTGSAPVTLLAITPMLPLHGLRPLGSSVRQGSCTSTGPALAGSEIGARERLIVTLRLGLPADCPKPYPVQVTIRERYRGRVASGLTTLLNDLGSLEFSTCPRE